jgi:hypothetical protein
MSRMRTGRGGAQGACDHLMSEVLVGPNGTGDREFGVATRLAVEQVSRNWFRNRVSIESVPRRRRNKLTTRSGCYGYYLASRLNSGVSVD